MRRYLKLTDESYNAPWFNTRVIRSKITIEHETPFERHFIEEITIINEDVNDVTNIPIPLTEFKQSLVALDEDNSVLSFFARTEIDEIITKLSGVVYEQIESLLSDQYLVWIQFPNNKPIHTGELRTIRLMYRAPEDSKNIKTSFFDIPLYKETIGKSVYPFEIFYFIKAPRDFVVEVDRKKTKAIYDKTEEEIAIKYLNESSSPSDFKSTSPEIKNRDCYISARFPSIGQPYKTLLVYKIKLIFVERLIWRTVLPVTAILLLGLILTPHTPYLSGINLKEEALFVLGGAVITISSALIALVNNPLVRRTRAFLFVHVILAIILIMKTGAIQTIVNLS